MKEIDASDFSLRVYIAESLKPEDFFDRLWEGRLVEEFVRLLGGQAFYRIVITEELLERAIKRAAKRRCEIFHLSCHGDEDGICLTDETELTWDELAHKFEQARFAPRALVLSSCLGGDRGVSRVFKSSDFRPEMIFGSEADKASKITFSGACIAWAILYSELVHAGVTADAFRDAVDKMNYATPHEFVYRRWDTDRYRRYPPAEKRGRDK